jgi:hypothetical protein
MLKLSISGQGFKVTSGTRDLRTPVVTSLQSPRMRSGFDQRCVGIRISRLYPQL